MNIKHGDGTTKYGPGVSIELDGDEVAAAISTYLAIHGVHIVGPRTITVNGELCSAGNVYVDPSGFVLHDGAKISGRGKSKAQTVTLRSLGPEDVFTIPGKKGAYRTLDWGWGLNEAVCDLNDCGGDPPLINAERLADSELIHICLDTPVLLVQAERDE